MRRLGVPEARNNNHQRRPNTGNEVLTETSEDTAEGLGLDSGVNRGRGQRRVQAEQVSSETGNVGGSHGSSRDGVCSTVVPGGDNVKTYRTGETAVKVAKCLYVPGAQTSTTAP